MTTVVDPQAMTPQAGQALARSFGGEELSVSAETSTAAVAAQSRAMVEARFVMALKRPRDMDDVRQKLKRACERPGFADSAWYRKPVGQGVEGFSVRFAEEAIRALGNLLVESPITWDDPHKRVVMVTVTDLENNVGFPTAIVIEKTVERRSLKQGQVAIGVRMNSKNEPTYIVTATDDEVLAKQNSLVSKSLRNQVLRLLPGDIQDECKRRIIDIRQGQVAKDPDGERKRMADAFAELNVMPSGLKQYLGHDLGTSTPAELVELRSLYTAIKSGEATWAEALAEKTGGEPEAAAAPTKTGLDAVAERVEKKAAEKSAAEPTKPSGPCDHAAARDQLRGAAPGAIRVCEVCGVDVHAEPPADREPGSDDGDEGAAATENRAAVEKLAKAAGRQSRLTETK